MAAGTKYNLNPQYTPSEFYRVESGVRKSGPYRLDISNLVVGSTLPVFTPVEVDLKKHTVKVVKNILVVEKFTAGGTALKIAKKSLAVVGMFIGNGEKGAEIKAIDKSKDEYDTVTLKAALDADVATGAVLFEAVAVDGLAKKSKANFVMYDEKKVEEGAVLVTLLMQAYEVKESKLILPIHEQDKEGLTSRFQFDY